MSREKAIGAILAILVSAALIVWLAFLPTVGAMWFLGFLGCSL
jgi:hypothetical protein